MLESLSILSALTRDLFLMLLVVSCPIPTGIPNGFITFAVMRQHGYKDKVRYGCNDHYVLDGEAETQCRNTGNWSSKPVCRGESWEHRNTCGFVSVCPSRNRNNQASFIPMCIMKLTRVELGFSRTAPCTVGIKRGRIVYNARKLWIADLKPNRVLHGEPVTFYCMNKADRCGYPVDSTCNDGILPIPECFEGKSLFISVKLRWWVDSSLRR